MATSQIASMLDELMGRNRNFLKGDSNARELKWTDSDVCRYFVVEFCPHDLFTNTKADLGPCGNIHDEDMRKKFHEDKDTYKKSQYLDDFLRFCQRMLSDLQNRIKRAKERLLLTQQNEERMLNAGGTGVSGGQNVEADEQVVLLSEKIAALVGEAEQAGIQGNVEQAQGLMKLCDQLREERDNLRRSVLPANAYKDEYNVQQKAMEVCETCGAFLIVGDAQQRIDDHLLGKQHMGYARLRAAIDKIMEEKKKFREEREKEVEDRRKNRDGESSEPKKRSSRESPDESKSDRKKRGGSRERRHRSRSRDRGGSRRKSSRSRERRRRSRDRSPVRERRRSRSRSARRGGGDSRRRSRSRDNRRSRSPRGGDKSRSERRRRSRSRDKDRRKESSRSRSREKQQRRGSQRRSRSRSRSSQVSKGENNPANNSSAAKSETENNNHDND